MYACTVTLCEPLLSAIPGVLMEVTLFAVNFALPSTHTFMYWAVPPLLNVALITTGDATVAPLAGDVMVTNGVDGGGGGGGEPVVTEIFTVCCPTAPLLSQAFTTMV